VDTVQKLDIRLLNERDPNVISAAFAQMGWNKPEAQYRKYLREQVAGLRTCFIAIFGGQFAGYVSVNWRPTYPAFSQRSIPEIQDLNVLRQFRRQGIASGLLDRAEAEVAQHSEFAGIGVGLHPGYNVAQRLYVARGYVPDGRGVTYKDQFMEEGAHVVLDDDLVLHLIKRLRPE
jgi:GNAT superfamily N-acetyltransferase